MTRELITSWGDYRIALDRLLAIAGRKICIYDEDLGQLQLESPTRIEALKRFLGANPAGHLRIALRNAETFQTRQPLLMKLLATWGHVFQACQTPPNIAHLRDSLILVDDKFGLIRFERDLPRSKLLIDEADELRPYAARFEDIWNEGGDPVNTTTLGL